MSNRFTTEMDGAIDHIAWASNDESTMDSTLMTSALQSVSAAPADGTYVHDTSSTTRTPRSTSDIETPSLAGCGHRKLPADLVQVSLGAAEEGAPVEQAFEI